MPVAAVDHGVGSPQAARGGLIALTATTLNATATKTLPGSDNSFGPQYGDSFDFTLLFDHSMFTIVPTALLVTACPLYIYFRRRDALQVERGRLFWAKMFAAFGLFVVQVAQLILWTTSVAVSAGQDWSIAASAMSCFAALCVAMMLNTEHLRSIQPSTLLSIYFGITVFLDGIKARSYLLRAGLDNVGAAQVVVVVTKLALLLLEEVPKTPKLPNFRKYVGKEALSGFWSRSLFLWLNEIFVVGFRQNLSIDDLGNLEPKFSTEALAIRFNEAWGNRNEARQHALLRVVLRMHSRSLLLAVPARILFSVCTFAQPLLIYHIVGVVAREDLTDAGRHSLVFATGLVYGGIGLFRAMYTHLNNRTVVLVRGTLLGKIYGKTLELPAKAAAEGAAMTHISADIEVITRGVQEFHDLWLAPFELVFAIYTLWLYIKYSCFFLVIPAILSTIWTYYFGPLRGNAQKVWNEKIATRVGQTTKLLSQVRAIKTTGLQDYVAEYIQGLRTTEIQFSQRFRWMQTMLVGMTMISMCFIPVIVIAGALYLGDLPLPLDARRVFATLAAVTLASGPVNKVLTTYPAVRALMSCIESIESYIVQQERRDKRSITPASKAIQPSGSEKGKDAEKKAAFGAPIELLNATCGPTGTDKAVVKNTTISIPHGKLTIATGPTGSGKTTFLKNVIGEANVIAGEIFVEEGPMAYCDQKAWLSNGTIQENIVGRHAFDETWYKSVLRYCCLVDDLRRLADGDQTNVGSDGSKLSGGQQQRVAIARALYSRAQVMIFDDVFSALDRRTAQEIFCGLFNSDGVLRELQTTVLLATHSSQFFEAADCILEFDGDNNVAKQDGKGNRDLETALESSDIEEKEITDEELPREKEAARAAASADDNETRKGDWTLWKFFFKSAPAWMFILFMVATVLNTACERAPPIFMRVWVDEHPYKKSLFAGYAVLGFAPTLTYLLMSVIFFQYIVPFYAHKMHRMLVQVMLGANLNYLTSTDHGVIINRISQDLTLVTLSFAIDFFRFPYAFVSIVADAALIVSASYLATTLLPFMGGMFYVVQLVYLRTSRQLRMLDLEAQSPMYSQLKEIAAGVEHIRAFQWKNEYLTQSYELIDNSQKPFYYLSCVQTWLALVLDSHNLVIALVLTSVAAYVDKSTSQTGIGLGFMGLLSLSKMFSFFMSMWTVMETSMGSLARLRSFNEDTPQEVDDANPEAIGDGWPAHGDIVFENVSAAYSVDNGNESVLRNVSFKINARDRAGFIGRTGSGKSSIFLTMLGFLPYTGSIKIDGKEVSRIPRNMLRTRVTAIPQEGLTLPGTIRQNLMPWLLIEAKPQEASQCSRQTIKNVLADTFMTEKIASAGGLDAPMEKLGLSAGEKQLFSMARSMCMNIWFQGQIVLMDEVTSNLDKETDSKLQKSIEKAFDGLTSLSIAHRTETVERADVVYEIDDGSVKTRE